MTHRGGSLGSLVDESAIDTAPLTRMENDSSTIVTHFRPAGTGHPEGAAADALTDRLKEGANRRMYDKIEASSI
jgi:hypothetical protein